MDDKQWEKLISESLSGAGKQIAPPRELLAAIIAKASLAEKTKTADWKRYFDLFFGRKIFFSAGMILVLLAIFFSVPANLKLINQHACVLTQAGPIISDVPQATIADQDINNQPLTADDVDAAATAILASYSDEDSTLQNDVSDESLSADADSLAIKNLINNYDQDQF